MIKISDIKINQIIRSNRKTIGLQITFDDDLIIRAPKSASLKAIQQVMAKHAEWIRKKQDYIRSHPKISKQRALIDSDEFLFLGLPYKLNFLDNGHVPLTFDNAFYLSNEYQPQAKILLSDWYISKAKDIIPERVCLQSQAYGLKFNRIHISNAKSRWGSCSSKGNLHFSWRLIMAPIESIDYVVIHELAHLKHRNHSKRFWGYVEAMMPDYKNHRLWLKKNERLMVL